MKAELKPKLNPDQILLTRQILKYSMLIVPSLVVITASILEL